MKKTTNLLKFFFICWILTTITNFPPAFTNSSVNTADDKLNEFIFNSYKARGWELSKQEESNIRAAIMSCWYIGQVFGAMMAPYITDGNGRKTAYIYATFSMILGGIVQYLSAVLLLPELLILGRFLCAIFSPLSDAALILYLQECSPINFRGMVSFFAEIGYCSMCLLGMILGMENVLGDTLTHLFSWAVLPGFFFLVFLLFIPETPKYLMITRKNRKAASKSLEFFQFSKEDTNKMLDEFVREAKMEATRRHTSSVKEVFSTWHLRHAVILASTVLMLNLPFFPILQSSTHFLSSEYLNFDQNTAQTSSTLLMLAFLLACILGSFFVDRVSRRFLIIFCGILSNLFLCVFAVLCNGSDNGFWTKSFVLGALFCYCMTFGMVLGPISWFVAPELVSQRHRSVVFCICYGINNVLITSTSFLFNYLFDLFGGIAMIPIFILPGCCCLVYIYLYLPETLGKETQEIVEEMRSRDPRKLDKINSEATSLDRLLPK